MKKYLKKILRKFFCVLLVSALTASILPDYPLFAEKTVTSYPYTLFAASDIEGAITVNAYHFSLNGSVATNGTIETNVFLDVSNEKYQNLNEDMIYFFDKIDTSYFSGDDIETYDDGYFKCETNNDVINPTQISGSGAFKGNTKVHSALKSIKDLNFNGKIESADNSVICSKYGDIKIAAEEVNINGLIYAPFGDVEITTQYLNLNKVMIIADTITLNCTNANIGGSIDAADFVGSESENYIVPYEDYSYFMEPDNWFYNKLEERQENQLDTLIIPDEDTAKYANTSVEYYGEKVNQNITDISEIYGQNTLSLTDLSYEDIVKKCLSQYIDESVNSITLSQPINLKDANDVVIYKGYNYASGDKNGYITIATHSKTSLIRDIVEDESIPNEYGDLYYLSSGEFYYWDKNEYHTLDDVSIEKTEFESFLADRRDQYFNFTKSILSDLEMDFVAQLNNLIYIVCSDFETSGLGKTYSGQSGSGYGGIDDCKKYLKARYGGTIAKKGDPKSLSMALFKQNTVGKGNNCTLAAITRILYYYYKKGYTKIGDDILKITQKVEKVAKKYGYSSSKGTWPTKINNIVEDVLSEYGYSKCKCNGIYIWNFTDQVMKQIDLEKPVILNILRGYYEDHSVTVSGYARFTRTKKILGIKTTKTYNMIEVVDGHETKKRFIDYNAFAYDLISSGFGSFNTITMKK